MGTLKIADPTAGDRRVTWDKGKKHEVEDAQASFDHHVKQGGYLAYKVGADSKKGEQIRAFDPNIEEMILIPPLRGG